MKYCLLFLVILFSNCRLHLPAEYYLRDNFLYNSYLKLNSDSTYFYGSYFYGEGAKLAFDGNIGTYRKEGRKLIFNSYNQLKNDTDYLVTESFDAKIKGKYSIKICLKDDSMLLRKGLRFHNGRFRINHGQWRELNQNYGRITYGLQKIVELSDTFESTQAIKELDISIAGVAYRRYIAQSTNNNAFNFVFLNLHTVKEFFNTNESVFENEYATIGFFRKRLRFSDAIESMRLDYCRECKTHPVFKKHYQGNYEILKAKYKEKLPLYD